jgi:phosphoribosylformylglycinamidine cyclo-ligase
MDTTKDKSTDIALRKEKEIYDPTKPHNEQIRELILSTHPSSGPITAVPDGKRFHIERDADYWKDFVEMPCTDGIGTKGMLHWQMDTEAFGAQDVFAMVMDDLIEGGHIPVIFQDHIMMQEENPDKILRIVSALTELSIKNGWKDSDGNEYPIIISGGETAIINTLQGFEVGISASGYVRKGQEIHAAIKEGDVIIGLGSNGIHSNGLSFYRQELFDKRGMSINTELPWGKTVGEELTRPTYVYLPAIKDLIRVSRQSAPAANELIHGMVHITGGGLSKLKELMPAEKNLDIEIMNGHRLMPQEIFRYAHDWLGMPSDQMYKKFNNGVGYVVAVENSFTSAALKTLRRHFDADVIGWVRTGTGKVMIDSQYEHSNKPMTVEYQS